MILKGKVYLSRSGAGNATLVNSIREMLQADPSIELVEYKGTTYTTAEEIKLKNSDILLVVPPTCEEDYWANDVYVGKGQFSQIEMFQKEKRLPFGIEVSDKIFVVCNYDHSVSSFTMRKVWDLHNDDGDWKASYGFIEMQDCTEGGDALSPDPNCLYTYQSRLVGGMVDSVPNKKLLL